MLRLNPFIPSGISHLYIMDESISNLNLKSTFCKQTVQNLIRCFKHCLPMSHKKMLGLNRLKQIPQYIEAPIPTTHKARTYARAHMHTHTRTHARTHTRTHARTHTHIRTHTHCLLISLCCIYLTTFFL